RQWIAQYLFDRSIRSVRLIILAAAGRLPPPNPVGRAVTSPAKSRGIHKGFRKIDRMLVEASPILRQRPRHAPERVRSQVQYHDPGQKQKAGVVSQQVQVAPPRCRTPAQEAAAALGQPRPLPGLECGSAAA